jgi:hypothetical protein
MRRAINRAIIGNALPLLTGHTDVAGLFHRARPALSLSLQPGERNPRNVGTPTRIVATCLARPGRRGGTRSPSSWAMPSDVADRVHPPGPERRPCGRSRRAAGDGVNGAAALFRRPPVRLA